MKAFLDTAGNGLPLCSASRYFSASAFGGSCSVTTLKCKSVRAGHEALIIAAAFWSSFAESGARGCDGALFAVRGVASVAVSVDMIADCEIIGDIAQKPTGDICMPDCSPYSTPGPSLISLLLPNAGCR